MARLLRTGRLRRQLWCLLPTHHRSPGLRFALALTLSTPSNMSRKCVDAQLSGINRDWSNTPSNITFRNYDHMEKSLAAARKYVVQFQTGEVEADFQGKTYKFESQYRDPWKWIYPAQKFLCENGVTSQLFDEPYTADKWWRIQCTLPHVPGMPHCYIPNLLWLDKGMVTKRVRKHPVMLRPLFLDGKIWNASGNGGGVLIAYMVIPIDPSDSSDRNAAQTIDWAHFKREIMHKVFKIIFATLFKPAKHGEALTYGDDIEQVCYPGIPITSIDGEEACSVSACRAALAHYPCPRCLVHHELNKICQTFTARTTETMQQFYEDAYTGRKGMNPAICWPARNREFAGIVRLLMGRIRTSLSRVLRLWTVHIHVHVGGT
ncbi:hypothetical protein DFH06DRAFT_1300668 [Mycena polygramma]|nr:hypothetical protein DFH06DRAFT_1300668 [Mycena polygramma]